MKSIRSFHGSVTATFYLVESLLVHLRPWFEGSGFMVSGTLSTSAWSGMIEVPAGPSWKKPGKCCFIRAIEQVVSLMAHLLLFVTR